MTREEMFPIAHQQPNWDGFSDGLEESEPYSTIGEVDWYWRFWHWPEGLDITRRGINGSV
jgi:hypothetical protein